ncbi:gamma-glutamyltransferase [Lentisphaera profundi]|uniref:Glutathione hydrolase proenzyme n=1 Tax=Lentisphaera profundi TaxID=1658616 RepID=A0ABY7VUY8_9BACT|nr:gamma-glutamyltransferase [Lentisphaera profundi]WDE95923.1 gamma-glutamyltransferase [Lentisphaera profundi]
MHYYLITLFFISSSLLLADPIIRAPNIDFKNSSISRAKNLMIVCQDDKAASAGLEILEAGGNAADAGVAIAYALAVTQPKAGNLGGGGFALYYDAETKKTIAIDFRERAPAATTKEDFLKADGSVDHDALRFSPKACAVPGTLAGIDFINKNFGQLKHKSLIEPAIILAEDGFAISAGLAYDLKVKRDFLGNKKEAKRIFFPEGKLMKEGDILVQEDLANTLRRLKKYGPSYFYNSHMGKEFVNWHKENGGLIALSDLKRYKVIGREPLVGNYRGLKIFSMPAPSSGGMHLIQMLNILENYNLEKLPKDQYFHLLAETMKLAYADRSHYPGDPDFNHIPQQEIISKKYAKKLKKTIKLKKARPAEDISHGKPGPHESNDTTHFSVTDRQGNVLSFTYTINYSFGSGIIIPGFGFFLNNEMDDFAILEGVPNSYGLLGGKANFIKSDKRPLSSMTPTIVFKNDKPYLCTGSPGGSRIITTVLQVLVNIIDFNMDLREATLRPRIHHQWLPDQLEYEAGLDENIVESLKAKGHNTKEVSPFGCTETIMIRYDGKHGFADPRRIDGKALGL